jgi:spermidine synthase
MIAVFFRHSRRIAVMAALLLPAAGRAGAEPAAAPAATRSEPGFWEQVGDFFLPHFDHRKILLEKQTPYNLVTVEKDYRDYRHLVFNPNRGSQGIWNPASPDEIVSSYCRVSTLFLTAIKREPRRVLFIGLGAGIVPRFVRERFPLAGIDVVEIDPEIPGIAEGYFGFRPDDRMKMITADGRDFINRTKESYDLIFVDAYTANEIPFQLTTVEFFRRVHAALAPDGLLIANIANLGKKEFIGSEIRTVREVFPELAVFVCGDGTNYLAMARSSGPVDADAMQTAATGLKLAAHPELDFREMLETRLSDDDFADLVNHATILKDDFAPVEILR